MEAIFIKFLMTCIVMVVIFAIYYIYKKQGNFLNIARTHNIQIVDSIQLEPRKKVTLLKCNGINHLILSNQMNDILISSFNDNEKVDLKSEEIKLMINKKDATLSK